MPKKTTTTKKAAAPLRMPRQKIVAAMIRRPDPADPRTQSFIPKPVGLLSDRQIRQYAVEEGMISPFCERTAPQGKFSWGLSSYGYDARVGNHFKVFTNVHNAIVDPKSFDERSFVEFEGDTCIIPPNSFALAATVERFRLPRNITSICVGRSSLARCGLIVNVTPLEPEWEGIVTLEFSNTTPLPLKLYANEGVCQFLFFAGTDVCETSYADRKGKYMGQTGVTLPRMEKARNKR